MFLGNVARMKSTKGRLTFLRRFLTICVCGSILVGIVLLNKTHDLDPVSRLAWMGQNGTFIHNPAYLHGNILPTLLHKGVRPVNTLTAQNLTENTSSNSTYQKQDLGNVVSVVLKKRPESNSKRSYELLQMLETTEPPCYDVHAFYYPWYGTPDHDGQYLHWNHPYIRHWDKKEAEKWPNYTHQPPDDVGSNFYPLLGAYSSRDVDVVDAHMKMMRYARIGVVVVSWYPPGDADNEGREPDSLLPLILEAANKYDLKVSIHVEPYNGRNPVTMRASLKYIYERYGTHPAFYRTSFKEKKNLPLIYIYDSYLVDSKDWATIFTTSGRESLRNTELNGIFIGLLVETSHKEHVTKSGFDGFYTYFATNRFTYGSTWAMWPMLAKFANSRDLLFIPSVGPGYIDTQVRPWNGANTRRRINGQYYNESFKNAFNVKPSMVSITSFNEWHEGTQIEPAIKKEIALRRYLDYGIIGPNLYLDLTKKWANQMAQK